MKRSKQFRLHRGMGEVLKIKRREDELSLSRIRRAWAWSDWLDFARRFPAALKPKKQGNPTPGGIRLCWSKWHLRWNNGQPLSLES